MYEQACKQLTPSQIEGFRVRLEAIRAALRAQLADAEQELAAPDTISDAESDRGDDSNMLTAHEQLLDLIAREQAELAQVERALARVVAGTYGISEEARGDHPDRAPECTPIRHHACQSAAAPG